MRLTLKEPWVHNASAKAWFDLVKTKIKSLQLNTDEIELDLATFGVAAVRINEAGVPERVDPREVAFFKPADQTL